MGKKYNEAKKCFKEAIKLAEEESLSVLVRESLKTQGNGRPQSHRGESATLTGA